MRAMEIVSENNPTFQPDVEEVNLDIDAQVCDVNCYQ